MFGRLLDHFPGEGVLLEKFVQRRFETVIIPACKLTLLRGASGFGTKTDFVFGGQCNRSQPEPLTPQFVQ